MATRETPVGSAYNVDHSNSSDMGDSHQVTEKCPLHCETRPSRVSNWQRLLGLLGYKPATDGDGIRRYWKGVKGEPKPRCKEQIREPGKSDHRSGNGMDWLRLMRWSDGGVAVVVTRKRIRKGDSGRESLPHGEGQQLNKRSSRLDRSSIEV